MDETKESKTINRLINELDIDEIKAKNLIEDAVAFILDYTDQEEMLDAFWVYARQLAVISYNQEGTEGETSRSEGGVSQSFIGDIPMNIQRGLNRYRIGKVVSFYAPKKE